MDIQVIASGSTGNCYRISDGSTSLLLECGIRFESIQAGCGYKTSSISGCLVTHRHGDHAKSVKKLIQRGIPVYGPQDLAEAYEGVTAWEPLQYHRIGSMTVLPFAVKHDVECYGYQIETDDGEKLLYVTDTAYVPYTFAGLTHIMSEANYSKVQIADNMGKGRLPAYLVKRIMKSHMSIDTLLEMLKANDMISVKQIYLLHLSDMNSNAERFKELVQRQTGAEVYVY